jgi:hypothetical protein
MPTVTLLAKAYDSSRAEQVSKKLKTMVEGLKIDIKVCGVTSRGWIQTSVSGEDENVAMNYLSHEIGLCPENLKNVGKFSLAKGSVLAINEDKNALHVDIGVFSPSVVDASIALNRLQAQMADGRRMALEKIARLFGFCKNLPLTLKIIHVDSDTDKIEAEMSEKQQITFRNWADSLLDRLLVMGVSSEEIMHAIQRTGFSRDVVKIEPLGILEHAVECKLGTDAAGLIPRMGRNLRRAGFSIFSPKKIRRFFREGLKSSTF